MKTGVRPRRGAPLKVKLSESKERFDRDLRRRTDLLFWARADRLDKTAVSVRGRWHYLYRAVDRNWMSVITRLR